MSVRFANNEFDKLKIVLSELGLFLIKIFIGYYDFCIWKQTKTNQTKKGCFNSSSCEAMNINEEYNCQALIGNIRCNNPDGFVDWM